MEEVMQVSHSYYEDEVRDGFYISGMMKRAWAASIEVLEEIDALCQKYHIKYFADAGTLLGAIRHKGFIPWDDDLDIGMLREDYTRFLEVAKMELPKDYALLSMHTEPDYEEIFARVVNRKQVSFASDDLAKFHNFPFVVGVDIFPLDYVAPNEEDENVRRKMARIVYDVAKHAEPGVKVKGLEKLIRQVEQCCKVSINRKGHVRNQLMLLLERLLTMYKAEEATEVAFMPIWIEKDSNKFKKECFNDVIEVDFENIKIPVPTMYDAILRKKYGDYMKLVHNWEFHDYPFYGDQMKYLEEHANIKYPKYHVTLEEVQVVREKKKNVKEQSEEMLALIFEANTELNQGLVDGNADVVFELLEMCQNAAVSIGGVIEESQGEGFVTVGLLEAYCEKIYQLYQDIVQGNMINVDKYDEEFVEILNRIGDSIQNDIKIRKEIVFLPCKASDWDALESVWQAAKEDAECDVYVIPIPYFEKDAFCSLTELHYEGDKFPEYVPVTSYKDYDLATHHPDMIFIQNPYDEYNLCTNVHPAFYSTNLKNYTNNLIYIPPFIIDEIHPEDGRAVASMDYFVKMPGVIHADKVILQSEEMKQSYINALVEFVGEESRSIWEEKILGLGSPKNDKKKGDGREMLSVPQEWCRILQKEDKSYKKVILYHTSSSMIIQEPDKYLQKLQSVLQTFRENQEDVALLWKPHPQTRETIETIYPQLLEKYQEIISEYQTEGFGIFDNTADDNRAVVLCDAYYGDSGDLAQKCRMAGKPVMIQAVNIY